MRPALLLIPLLAGGCAFGVADRPRADDARLGVHRITCPSPPRGTGEGLAAVSVVPFPRDLISVGERGAFNFDPNLDERVVIDGPDFAKRIAEDAARALGGPSTASGAAPRVVELQVTRIASTLDRGGAFSFRGTIRGVVSIRGRVASADPAAPWPWTFEADAEKRVAYIQVGDYVETLGNAYCRVLEEMTKRASELQAARAPSAG